MRADDVSPAMMSGHAAPAATSPYARPTTGPQPVVPSGTQPEQIRADLLYEFELELRHTAKALARSKHAPAPILVAVPVANPKPGVPDVSWRATDLRGWMIGPRLCVLEDGAWVPHTIGRTHKLDKPRHQRLFGDANSKEYAQRWQDLTDAGVTPGGAYIYIDQENEPMLGVGRHPRRAELFEVQQISGSPHLVMLYDRGSAGVKVSDVREDLQKRLKDYA